jgi:HEPN domain-containing protein
MRPLTAEWVAKAEEDFDLAQREKTNSPRPALDAVCFHAQQSAEKYIKAVLQERDIPFSRSHDLVVLALLIDPPVASFQAMQRDLTVLSQLAVATRYPGYAASAQVADDALRCAEKVRGICRSLLQVSIED